MSTWKLSGKLSGSEEISFRPPALPDEVFDLVESLANYPDPNSFVIDLLKPWNGEDVEVPKNPFDVMTNNWRINNRFKIRRKYTGL